MNDRYLVLLHSPMLNRRGEVVTTAVTNLDIHDLARTARTYGLRNFFIVTPIADQRVLVQRILNHWLAPDSCVKHPDRTEALSRVRVAAEFDDVVGEITQLSGAEPVVLMPDARELEGALSYDEVSGRVGQRPCALVLGTGWGLAPEFFKRVTHILKPLYGSKAGGLDDYNHLSVRAAGAVVCDRIWGRG